MRSITESNRFMKSMALLLLLLLHIVSRGVGFRGWRGSESVVVAPLLIHPPISTIRINAIELAETGRLLVINRRQRTLLELLAPSNSNQPLSWLLQRAAPSNHKSNDYTFGVLHASVNAEEEHHRPFSSPCVQPLHLFDVEGGGQSLEKGVSRWGDCHLRCDVNCELGEERMEIREDWRRSKDDRFPWRQQQHPDELMKMLPTALSDQPRSTTTKRNWRRSWWGKSKG